MPSCFQCAKSSGHFRSRLSLAARQRGVISSLLTAAGPNRNTAFQLPAHQALRRAAVSLRGERVPALCANFFSEPHCSRTGSRAACSARRPAATHRSNRSCPRARARARLAVTSRQRLVRAERLAAAAQSGSGAPLPARRTRTLGRPRAQNRARRRWTHGRTRPTARAALTQAQLKSDICAQMSDCRR